MRVLVLDDRIEALDAITERLEEEGYHVARCLDIYEADVAWNTGDIWAIITDLSMSSEGLNPLEKKKTGGTILTGWIWLIYHVCAEDNHRILSQTIVYSEYIGDATKIVHAQHEHERFFTTVTKMNKSEDGLDKLVNQLNLWRGGI